MQRSFKSLINIVKKEFLIFLHFSLYYFLSPPGLSRGPLSSLLGEGGGRRFRQMVFFPFFALLVIFSNILVTTSVCFMLIYPSPAFPNMSVPALWTRIFDTFYCISVAEPEPDRTEVFWLVPEPDRTFLVGSGHIFRKMIYTQPAPAKTMVPILNKIQNNCKSICEL